MKSIFLKEVNFEITLTNDQPAAPDKVFEIFVFVCFFMSAQFIYILFVVH